MLPIEGAEEFESAKASIGDYDGMLNHARDEAEEVPNTLIEYATYAYAAYKAAARYAEAAKNSADATSAADGAMAAFDEALHAITYAANCTGIFSDGHKKTLENIIRHIDELRQRMSPITRKILERAK